MYLKVLYTDFRVGREKSSTVRKMMTERSLIAVHCSSGWYDVRRKSNRIDGIPYHGIDRRKNKPESFFQNLNP